jgi:hypothetical protein
MITELDPSESAVMELALRKLVEMGGIKADEQEKETRERRARERIGTA